jgi:hypothetical protein
MKVSVLIFCSIFTVSSYAWDFFSYEGKNISESSRSKEITKSDARKYLNCLGGMASALGLNSVGRFPDGSSMIEGANGDIFVVSKDGRTDYVPGSLIRSSPTGRYTANLAGGVYNIIKDGAGVRAYDSSSYKETFKKETDFESESDYRGELKKSGHENIRSLKTGIADSLSLFAGKMKRRAKILSDRDVNDLKGMSSLLTCYKSAEKLGDNSLKEMSSNLLAMTKGFDMSVLSEKGSVSSPATSGNSHDK